MRNHRRAKQLRKRGAALLVCTLLAGLVPAVPGAAVHAAAPGITKFATREELLSSFDLNNSTEGTVQKVYFGKGSNGNAQTWYIAGREQQFEGAEPEPSPDDALVLMCDPERPLIESLQFSRSSSYQLDYDPSWGCSYESGREPTYVSNNHYGGSDLRAALRELEGDTAYFSEQEQDFMAKTDILTHDVNSTNYITHDTLYAASVLDGSYQYIAVGTRSGNYMNAIRIDLDGESPFASGKDFWLRKPNYPSSDNVHYIKHDPSGPLTSKLVTETGAAVPAFQLDLSSVLFASAASAAASTGTTVDDAFTLRYESTDLGIAAINPGQTYVAVKGAPSGTYLVVQNDSGAWARAVSGDVTVAAGEIDPGLSSFADCKVWLEITDSDRITKATLATILAEYQVTITPGGNMTRTAGSGDAVQTALSGFAIADIVYEADAGYFFPTDYAVPGVNGISVTRNSDTQVTVSGTPTDAVALTLPAATAKAEEKESIEVTPVSLDFGLGRVFAAKTVQVSNTGKGPVTLKQPEAHDFKIGYLSDRKLEPGAIATFTVQPKEGLIQGIHREEILVETTQGTRAIVLAEFKQQPKPPVPDISNPRGDEWEWVKGSQYTLVFVSDAAYKEFIGVRIDGKVIESGNYTVEPGSTIVTLLPEYLETLSVGTHTIGIVSTNGEAEAKFTIVAAHTAKNETNDKASTPQTGDKASTPRTGDNSPLPMWLGLLFLSGGGIAVSGIRKRRRTGRVD